MKKFELPTMTIVNDDVSFDEFVMWIAQQKSVVFDIETTGLDVWHADHVMGIGIGTIDRQFYLSFGHSDSKLTGDHKKRFVQLIQIPTTLIAHNFKFDITGLWKDQFIDVEHSLLNQNWHDIFVFARLSLYDKTPGFSLRSLTARFFGGHCNRYDSFFHNEIIKKQCKRDFAKAVTEDTAIYCMNDVICEAKLYQLFDPILQSRGMQRILDIDTRLTKVLWKIERTGITIDVPKCHEMIQQISVLAQPIQDEVDKFLPDIKAKYPDYQEEHVNISSSHDLKKLFTTLGVTSAIKTPSGEASWNENALLLIKHPVANSVRLYRSLMKVKSTYIDNYLASPDGKLRGSFKNWGTVTGRLAATEGIQTFPRLLINLTSSEHNNVDALSFLKSKAGKKQIEGVEAEDVAEGYMSWMAYEEAYDETRHLSAKRPLVAEAGFDLVGFDFSQMELRVFFRYVNTPEIIKYLSDPTWEGHGWVAGQIWGVKKGDEKYPYYRQMSKAINFGLIYGEGLKTLAGQLDTTVDGAREFKNLYFKRLPGAREFIQSVGKKLQLRGYVHNMFGRQYSVSPDMSYVLVNYLVQGTCADFVKDRMIKVDEYFRTRASTSRMVLQVHDELVFELQKSTRDQEICDIKAMLEEDIIGTSLPTEVTLYDPSYANKNKYEIKTV